MSVFGCIESEKTPVSSHESEDKSLVTTEAGWEDIRDTGIELQRRYGDQDANSLMAALTDPIERERFETNIQGFINLIHNRMGICCFAEVNNDILMWSHYSDCHRGIGVQIDTSEMRKQFRDRLFKVTYQDEYPHFSILKNKYDLFVTIKAKYWEYEQEWRAILDKQDVFSLSPRAIHGIILGCAIEEETEQLVRSWIKNRHTKTAIFRAVKKTHEYGLDIIREK